MVTATARAVDVWWVDLSPGEDVARMAASILSAEEQVRASRMALGTARRTFTQARAVLRCLLADRCDLDPRQITFAYGPCGKPSLDRSLRQMRFNLSHCGLVAAYVFDADGDVGIDVERCGLMPAWKAIATRFLGEREIADLCRLPPAEQSTAFIDYWVRREAVVKALGGGLSSPFRAFDVSREIEQTVGGLTVHALPPRKMHRGAVAFAPSARLGRIHYESARQLLVGWASGPTEKPVTWL